MWTWVKNNVKIIVHDPRFSIIGWSKLNYTVSKNIIKFNGNK